MLRPAAPADTPTLVPLAAATGVFKPFEIDALLEVLDDYHAVNHTYGHRAAVWDDDGQIAGFVYYAPTAMTDRTWEMWWVAVAVEQQGRGLGGQMLVFVEDEVRRADGRLLLIETSSTPAYHPTRGFYLKHGYTESARIRDFYADGDDKVIYCKRMSSH